MPARFPVFREMDLPEGEVLQSFRLYSQFFLSILLDAALEEELLQAYEHSSLVQLLRLFALLVDFVELLEVCIREYIIDNIVHLLVEGVWVTDQLVEVLVDPVKVVLSELLITHDQSTSVSLLGQDPLDGKLGGEMLPSALHCQRFVSDIDANLPQGVFCLVIESVPDFLLRSRLFIDPQAQVV